MSDVTFRCVLCNKELERTKILIQYQNKGDMAIKTQQ